MFLNLKNVFVEKPEIASVLSGSPRREHIVFIVLFSNQTLNKKKKIADR